LFSGGARKNNRTRSDQAYTDGAAEPVAKRQQPLACDIEISIAMSAMLVSMPAPTIAPQQVFKRRQFGHRPHLWADRKDRS